METKSLYGGQVVIDFEPKRHIYKINGESIPSVTSITRLMDKPALLWWATGEMEKEILSYLESRVPINAESLKKARSAYMRTRDAAADSGTMVHDWIENHIKSKVGLCDMPPIPEFKEGDEVGQKLMNGIQAFLQWESENDVRFVASEQFVYSRKHHYCGKFDFSCTMASTNHRLLHIADNKTSKGIYSEMMYQTSGYQGAVLEEYEAIGLPDGIDGFGDRLILRLNTKDQTDKDGNIVQEAGTFEAKMFGGFENDYSAFLGLLAVRNREQDLKEALK